MPPIDGSPTDARGSSSMTTRERNIYLIRPRRGGACLVAAVALLALSATPAMAQCEDVGSAGDAYCEALPGAGGNQGAAEPPVSSGVPGSTQRSLERSGASAVTRVQSPRRDRRRAAQAASGGTAAAEPKVSGAEDGRSALPFILAGLALVLVGTALLRRRSGSTPAGGSAA
jgi:hypothetical protein